MRQRLTAPDPYVATRAIQSAVRGREAEVLDALGIDRQAGHRHIRCPYPDHNDASPSWRFDDGKRRAYCTCIERSHSIFDVAAKMRGGDFEAAKLFVAEAIGRGDLIRARDVATRRYPSSDAASLLDPPVDCRDDGLARAYLAHRLGVAAGAVSLPSTPVAGWTALPYFDPPASGRRNAKRVRVGDYPCAVFGMRGVDGGQHAHRVYLAPGGAGKASLGTSSGGHPRPAKKSAKVPEGETIAGRAVLWGDPTQAERIIVAEGIETAAAIALAYGEEIAAGGLAVAAAISATGIEAFRPWPATRRITIAADRDEAAKADGAPGSRRGERAARRLGLRLHELLTIDIALPGEAGERIDYLDLLRRDGTHAVRASIATARRYMPTAAEREEDAGERARADALTEMAKRYPMPALSTIELSLQYTRNGQIAVHLTSWERDPAGQRVQNLVPIATPFGVAARLRQADHADAYGLRIVVEDMAGHPRNVDISRAQLARRGAPEVLCDLYAAGLRVEPHGEAIVVAALKAAHPDNEIVIVSSPGWHILPGMAQPAFVAPSGDVIGTPETMILELAAKARIAPDAAVAGTLDSWREAITAALAVDRCPHWILGTVAGFAGVVASLACLDTCGINLSGLSSGGKSTAQRLAASAWSTPDIRRSGLCQSARATGNAVEALASRASGTVLVLDELAHISGEDAARMIYTIAGGSGKRRMTVDATLRDSYSWSTFVVLSGEASLAQQVTRDEGKWSAGMAVRIVDIDVTDTNRNVDMATLAQIDAIERHYGHAGPAFVRALIEGGYHRQPAELRDRVMRAARQLAGEDADAALIRAATPLALLSVAGELAKTLGIIPGWTEVGHGVAWAWDEFLRSSDAAALDTAEQAFGKLREFAARHWDVDIRPVSGGRGGAAKEAIGWYDDDAVYLPPEVLLDAIGGVIKERAVGRLLSKRGLLARRDSDHYTVRNVPTLGKVRAYALKRSEFGRTQGPADASPRFTYG